MAAVELLLSSSPPRFSGCQVAAMSSSPIFPSPGALMRSRPQLKSGGGAALVLAATTFPNTSSKLVIHELLSTEPGAAPEDPFTENPPKPKPSRKPKTDEPIITGKEPTVKKPRKPRATKVVIDNEATTAPAEKPTRKTRLKKAVAETQRKLPKGRVTKASTSSRAGKMSRQKKTEEVSGHFQSAAVNSGELYDISMVSKNDLLLQEAVKRRRNWTPPKAAVNTSEKVITMTESNGEFPGVPSVSSEKHKSIPNIFAEFRYDDGDIIAATEQVVQQLGTKKRKIIDLVSKHNIAPENQVPKAKAAKKKPRTITEAAISAYATNVGEDKFNLSPLPSLQYFSHKDQPLDGKITENIDGFKVPPKPRSKSPVKTAKQSAKARKVTAQSPLLLSPQSALKRAEKQEFVFGTSSQLVREDSPTLLRDLQEAMRASNQAQNDAFADIIGHLSIPRSPSAAQKGTESYLAKRNLWSAASNGVNGASTYIEAVDMTDSPQTLPLLQPSAPLPGRQDAILDITSTPVDDEWLDLDANISTIKGGDEEKNPKPFEVRPVEAAVRLETLSSLVTSLEAKRPLSRAISSVSKTPPQTHPPLAQISAVHKPDYGGYPTSRLAKEIASYHFKPVKGRDQMISLLERCWEGQQKVAGINTEKAQERSTSSSDNNHPLVLRQTPKKQKKKVTPIPEEIYDSDGPLTPSPPRRRITIRTPPLSLETSVSDNHDESLVLSPTSQQVILHKHITQAITSAPRSTDPTNPSWHEKILLYDPIILEDLAAWLNMGPLQKVGWDGEVNPKEVKRWCMAKSICCLWRENLRGRARSRV